MNNILEWCKTLFKREKTWYQRPKTFGGMSASMYDKLARKGCLDCGSMEFQEGPSGGLCTNFKCADCGSEYNVNMFMSLAQRI